MTPQAKPPFPLQNGVTGERMEDEDIKKENMEENKIWKYNFTVCNIF